MAEALNISIAKGVLDALHAEWSSVSFTNCWLSGAVEGGLYEGGPECHSFVPWAVHCLELAFFPALYLLLYCLCPVRRAPTPPTLGKGHALRSAFRLVDLILGSILLLVFLIEIGFKVLTRKVIFLLQPCHLVTAFQIYGLLSRSHRSDFLVALHFPWLMGALGAITSPDVSGLKLPFEVEIFWIQHILIAVIVPCQLLLGHHGIFSMFRKHWFALPWLGTVIHHMYHWLLLAPLSYLSAVNINFMLYPIPVLHAIEDVLGFPMAHYRAVTTSLTPLLSMLSCYVYLVPAFLIYSFVGKAVYIWRRGLQVSDGSKYSAEDRSTIGNKKYI